MIAAHLKMLINNTVFQYNLIMLLITVTHTFRIEECREPTLAELNEQWVDEYQLSPHQGHESLTMHHHFRELYDVEVVDRSPSASQSTANNTGDSVLSHRSFCQWTSIIRQYEDIFPSRFLEVQCLPASRDRCHGSLHTYSCQPVTYNVQVIKRSHQCKHGVIQYKRSWHEIHVACACARQRSSLVSRYRRALQHQNIE